MLSLNEKNAIMKRFPEIELSYENLLHKKVYTDGYFIIPKGKKIRLSLEHYLNPLHIYCRLIDIGIKREMARSLSIYYEKVLKSIF